MLARKVLVAFKGSSPKRKRFSLRSSPGKIFYCKEIFLTIISWKESPPRHQLCHDAANGPDVNWNKKVFGKCYPCLVTSKSRHMIHYEGFQGLGLGAWVKLSGSDDAAHFDPEHFIQIQNTKYVLYICIKHYLLLDFKSLL